MGSQYQPYARISSLATAVPPYKIPQTEVVAFFERFFDASILQRKRLERIYLNAEIETRFACAPVEWYEKPHPFKEKNDLFLHNAVGLLKRVAIDALTDAGLECDDIDMLVVVSTTGIAVPSLDARLMEELPFRRNVKRLPVFGFGCAGGVLGLARAAAFARTGCRVLLLVVELCTLTFCSDNRAAASVVATALFGDGAAGAVLTAESGPAIVADGEYTWQNSLDVMGWEVTGNGLEVVMSRSIPAIARQHVRDVTDDFLALAGLCLADIDEFICHPGGAKVIEALERSYELPPGGLAFSRSVLRDFGNMSAVTVLFVLQRALEAANRGQRSLLTSLGPGFTMAFLVLEQA